MDAYLDINDRPCEKGLCNNTPLCPAERTARDDIMRGPIEPHVQPVCLFMKRQRSGKHALNTRPIVTHERIRLWIEKAGG